MNQNYTPISHLIDQIRAGNNAQKTGFGNQQTPAPPFHPGGPESEPSSGKMPEQMQIQEHVEHNVKDTHVQQYVQERPQNLQVPQHLQNAGVKPVSKTGKFAGLRNVQIPLADEKVLEGKKAPVSSSIRWLSELATYILKKAHIKLKKVGGKVVRVVNK